MGKVVVQLLDNQNLYAQNFGGGPLNLSQSLIIDFSLFLVDNPFSPFFFLFNFKIPGG